MLKYCHPILKEQGVKTYLGPGPPQEAPTSQSHVAQDAPSTVRFPPLSSDSRWFSQRAGLSGIQLIYLFELKSDWASVSCLRGIGSSAWPPSALSSPSQANAAFPINRLLVQASPGTRRSRHL